MNMRKMKARKVRAAAAAAALSVGLITAHSAQATLQIYEGFNYNTGTASGISSQGVLLTGQSGGVGMTGSWATTGSNGSFPNPTVYMQGTSSLVNSNGSVVNPFQGTVGGGQVTTSGGYMGPVGQNGNANTTDHIRAFRSIDPSIAATFLDGTSTWISFVSVRAFNANASAPKLAIGSGSLSEDRGFVASGEAIGVGGGTGSNAGSNTSKIYGQMWDESTTGNGSFQNYDITGIQTVNSASTTPLTVPTQAFAWDIATFGDLNFTVAKITWHTGTPDVISYANFTTANGDFNGTNITEANFNTRAITWSTGRDLNQTAFNTISLEGGRYFVDELRVGTAFADMLAQPVTGNNSQILITSAPGASDGATGISTKTIAFSRVMLNSSQTSAGQTITKTGTNDTTFTVASAGDVASTTLASGSLTGAVPTASGTITLNTASTGIKSGTVTIDNTAADSAAAGQGSADGNDVFTVTGTVVANRTVSASSVAIGNVLRNATAGGTTNLSTSGDINNFTSVTVASQLFNSAGSTGSTSVSKTFTTNGSPGTSTLTTTAEGLAGESPINVVVTYTGTVGNAAADKSGGLHTFGAALHAVVANGGGSYANLESNTTTTSGSGTSAALIGTTATILSGSNTTGSAEDITMAWRTRLTTETNFLVSDVTDLNNVTGTYVFQMSYRDADNNGIDDIYGIAEANLTLVWLNGSDVWENAIFGNTGNLSTVHHIGAWNNSFVLGDWGVDTTANVVWAVVNHNSEFAVAIPSPMGLPGGLALMTIVGVISRRRRA